MNYAMTMRAVSKSKLNPLATALVGVGVAYLAWKLAHTLLAAFAGVLLAILIWRLADKLAKLTHLPRTPALIIVMLSIVAVFGSLIVLLGPQTATQLTALSTALPESIAQAEATIRGTTVGAFVLDQLGQRSGQAKDIMTALGGTLSKTFSTLIDVFVILSVAMFLAFDPALYRRGLLHLVPISRRARIAEVLDTISDGLWKWIVATILSSAIVGVAAGIGLTLIGVPLAAGLGVIAGLTNIIPNFGPLIAGGIAAVLAFSVSPIAALATVALFFVINR